MTQRAKGNGVYAPLGAGYFRDDALLEAGEAAELLFVRGLSYCAETPSDGFISDRQLTMVVGIGMRDALKRAEKLCQVDLWQRVEGGYVVRSWLKWNKSAEEIGRFRKRDRERKATKAADGIQTDSTRIPDGTPTESALQYTTQQYTSIQSTSATRGGEPPAPIPIHDRPDENDRPDTAGILVAEWMQRCAKRPPNAVIGQTAKSIRQMLSEGISADDIRAGMQVWESKGLHPAALPSAVNEAMNARPAARRSTSDDKFQATLALAAKYDAEDASRELTDGRNAS